MSILFVDCGILQQRPSTVVYPDRKATLCDSKLRTLNVDAQCGSDSDLWYYAPWRSPGLTPVNDACGTAGGRVAGQGQGSQVNFSIDAFLSFPNVALFNFFFVAHTTVLLTQSLFSHVFFFGLPPRRTCYCIRNSLRALITPTLRTRWLAT